MNVRVLAAVSVLANVALVALALRMGRTAATGEAGTGATTGTAAELTLVKTNLSRVEMTITNQTAPFHWSQIESDDLKSYAEKLRGIGCPAETVRDIIEGAMDEWFLTRRRALLEPVQRRYWDLAASGKDFDDATESFEEPLDKLKEERTARLKVILGEKPEQEPEHEKQSRNQHVDFLPLEKQQAMADLETKFNEEMAKFQPEGGGKLTPEKAAQRDQLQRKRRAVIRAMMTDDEDAEYELRQSRHARAAYVEGFEPTQEEARAVARIYQQFEAADKRPDRKDPDAVAKKAQAAEAKRQREETVKQRLGEQRYEEFQQGMDGNFGRFHRITRRYDLPRETAWQAGEAMKAREQAMKQLRADKTMSAEDRAGRELAVNLETRAAALRAIGERALRTYEKYEGPIVPRQDDGE